MIGGVVKGRGRQAALPQPQAPGHSPIGQGKATLALCCSYMEDYKICVSNTLIPMPINIMPPNNSAHLPSHPPIRIPTRKPISDIEKATIPIITAAT